MIEENISKFMWAAGAIVVAGVLFVGSQVTFPKLFEAVGSQIETPVGAQKPTLTQVSDVKPNTDTPFKFKFNSSDKTATVTGFKYGRTMTDVEIPSTIVDNNVEYTVTSIGDDAFIGSNALIKKITSVKIPNSIISIGERAFAQNEIKSLTLPDLLTNIGYRAFSQNEIASVVIPDTVVSVGQWAFSINKLTSVKIPNSITTISYGAFAYNQLIAVDLPNSITSIEEFAFFTNQITSLKIPDSVTTIGLQAFGNNKIASLIIPNSVTQINDNAFLHNNLTSVVIPNPQTIIGNNVFDGAVKVTQSHDE